MLKHMRRVGDVDSDFLGKGGVLREVIAPLLTENESIDLVFFAYFRTARVFSPPMTTRFEEECHRGHVILTNYRFIWMLESEGLGQVRVVKSYPWHEVRSWSFFSWIGGQEKERRGFSLHVDLQCAEVDAAVNRCDNIMKRENVFLLDSSVDAKGFALVSRRLSAMVFKQRKLDDSASQGND